MTDMLRKISMYQFTGKGFFLIFIFFHWLWKLFQWLNFSKFFYLYFVCFRSKFFSLTYK
jgi:hypothetical protein